MSFTLAALAEELEAQAARADQEDQSLIQETRWAGKWAPPSSRRSCHRENGA